MIIEFESVRLGEFFQFRGRRFRKIALSLAEDEERMGCVFLGRTKVLGEGAAPKETKAREQPALRLIPPPAK